MVVAQLARLGAEAEERNLGYRWGLIRLEAQGPFVLGLVLQLQFQVLLLEVGQAGLGRNVRVANAPGRAARELGALAIGVFIGRMSSRRPP